MSRNVAEAPLLALLSRLRQLDYRFTAVTPATHARIVGRRGDAPASDLRDIFGWNLPFSAASLPSDLLDLLVKAEAVEEVDGLLKSRFRVASIGTRLFLHSSFPTDAEDAVFFGPDTYRFVRMISAELPLLKGVRRLVDIGAGSGAGAIMAAAWWPEARITLTDVNAFALRLAAVNAKDAGVEVELVESSGLADVDGAVDVVLANPPYIMDENDRAYRNGGDMHGAQLSRDWALAAARRIDAGGRMLLYTGVAIVKGQDALRTSLREELPPLGCTLRYEEIDPDIFSEELEEPAYREVERIAAVGAVIEKR
jgi:methylase of polypeptide subunit release factors